MNKERFIPTLRRIALIKNKRMEELTSDEVILQLIDEIHDYRATIKGLKENHEQKTKIAYLCDRRRCEKCGVDCTRTFDIEHAKNFRKEVGLYIEVDQEKDKTIEQLHIYIDSINTINEGLMKQLREKERQLEKLKGNIEFNIEEMYERIIHDSQHKPIIVRCEEPKKRFIDFINFVNKKDELFIFNDDYLVAYLKNTHAIKFIGETTKVENKKIMNLYLKKIL